MNRFPLWSPDAPVTPYTEIPLPDVITHVVVERSQHDGWHYLHETALAMHKGRLYYGWANSREKETNTSDEIYRGRSSDDGGLTWSDDFLIGPGGDDCAQNHGAMISHLDTLWCFLCRHDHGELTGTEALVRDDDSGDWSSRGIVAPGFIPFQHPLRLADGNWLMAGETAFLGDMAVALSDGDDFTTWTVVPIANAVERELVYPETTVYPAANGDLIAVSRVQTVGAKYTLETPDPWHADSWGMAARSSDHGRTWSAAIPTNLPIWPSKPFAGRLSDGRAYLIHNAVHPDPAHRRDTLAIAISAPGADLFSRIYRIRAGQCPGHAHYSNRQWSYPSAIEVDGKLLISYSINKSDAGLSILPLSAI